jgi:hypothetical protein
LHGLISSNPVQHESTTNYRGIVISPAQTLRILKSFTNVLHLALVLTCAATVVRASEILSLRWNDVIWDEGRIRVSKRWAKSEDGDAKTEASTATFRCTPAPLAQQLASEQNQGRAQNSSGSSSTCKIQNTLDLYTQEDSDETRGTQGEFLEAMGLGNHAVQ